MIGITERGDPVFDHSWVPHVKAHQPTILITKDPSKLYQIIEDEGLCTAETAKKLIVHCTITGLGGSIIEPNVPPMNTSLGGLSEFIAWLGTERVVLRIDPIIATRDNCVQAAVDVRQLGLRCGVTRVRISFLDMYKHVAKRFAKIHSTVSQDFHASLAVRHKIWKQLGCPDICAEPGMSNTGCISRLDCQLLGVAPAKTTCKQRSTCACLNMKKELLKHRKRCKHMCLYCYWKD